MRRFSQVELSLRSGISTRHLSYAETGRARPSRQTVQIVAEALDVPLRERNALLLAAGYAPHYPETALDAPELVLIRRAIDVTLAQHEPFPAFVLNRTWDIQSANAGTARVLGGLSPGGPKHNNIVRQVFDPEDLRPLIENWNDVAADLLVHLHHAVLQHPTDDETRALLDEALSYPDIPGRMRSRDLNMRPLPVLVTTFRKDDLRLNFFSTLTRFVATTDIAVEETRIECMHPADDATRDFCSSAMEVASC